MSLPRVWILPVLLATLPLGGCGSPLDPNQTSGELGNGSFRYLCVESGDALCASGGEASTFPERVATTSLFDVRFEPKNSSDASGFNIVPAAAGIIEDESDILRAKVPGTVALLAKRTADSRVLDFVHLTVVDVDHIRFDSNAAAPRLAWATGARQTLRATPLDKDGIVLAGGLSYTWATSDPSVIRLELANPTAEMELLPLAPGTVTISVTSGSRTDTLTITVEGAPAHVGPDGGGVLFDAGPSTRHTDAGTDAGGPPLIDAAMPPDAATSTPIDGAVHD